MLEINLQELQRGSKISTELQSLEEELMSRGTIEETKQEAGGLEEVEIIRTLDGWAAESMLESMDVWRVSQGAHQYSPAHRDYKPKAVASLQTLGQTADPGPALQYLRHLRTPTKEKIWLNEYVDLLLLLPFIKDFSKPDRKEDKADENRCHLVTKSFQIGFKLSIFLLV